VIVSGNQRRCVHLERPRHNGPQRWADGLNGALGDQRIFKQRVATIQIQYTKLLLRQPTHPLAQIFRRSCRALDHQFATLYGHGHATGNLHGCEKLGCLCSLEPLDFQQRDDWRFDHRT
jgi:hypothetical protein